MERTTGQRLKDPTPPYFKKIRRYAVITAAIGAMLIGMDKGVPSLDMPIIIAQIGEIMTYVGTAVAGFSFLPSTKA